MQTYKSMGFVREIHCYHFNLSMTVSLLKQKSSAQMSNGLITTSCDFR